MKKYYLNTVLIAIGLLYSCSAKKEKPTTNYANVDEVLDSDFVTSDTIIQSNTSFINTASNQEVSILHHLDETGFQMYNDVLFKTENIGVLVGGAGLNTRITKNGGKTWLENRFSRFGNPFFSVAFSENSIFVVGDDENIFKTEDYGENWGVFNTVKVFGKEGGIYHPKYYKIRFVNKELGFVTGVFEGIPVILKTVDGGDNWTNIKHIGLSENTNGISDFVAFSEKEIMIVTFSGKCYKSIDGGIHWKLLYHTETINLNSISFLNSQIGFIGGSNGLAYTNNGGENWRKITMPEVGEGHRANISDIIFLANSALITTAIDYSDYRETFVYEIDKDGTNIRPFLTTADENVTFMGDSYGIEVLHNAVYILDRNNLYKTIILKK